MNKALFAALASVALLGASCSVQDFSTVVLDKPFISAEFPTASFSAEFPTASFSAVSNADGYMSTADTLGKYSLSYGLLNPNLFEGVRLESGTYNSIIGSTYSQNKADNNTRLRVEKPLHLGTGDFTFTCSSGYQFYVDLYNSSGVCVAGTDGWKASPFTYSFDYSYLSVILRRVDGAPISLGERASINLVITRGSSSAREYGCVFDAPFLDAPMRFGVPLGDDLKPFSQYVYDGFPDTGFRWMLTYGYKYVDNAHPRTMQSVLGLWFVNEEQRSVFLSRFTDLALPRKESSNMAYVDYELLGVNSDGTCSLHIYFKPVFFHDQYISSYFTFNTGTYDDGYTDGYDYGYMVGYQSQTYEIVKGIEEVSLSYIVGSGDEAENRNVTKSNGEAFELLRANCINGLLQLDAIYNELIPSSDSDAHSLVLLLSYSDAKTVDAAPLYIDYKQLADPIPYAQQTEVTVYTPVNLPVQRWIAFNAHLDVGYQGDLGKYPEHSYNERFRNYNRISVRYPTRDVGGALRYLGILSDYTRGYADGVSSRDGEVDDLTNRILSLQEDLSQYRGKDYQQIYNLGYQAGLDENAQGAATFNSLFGNILTAPLTILNGLTDISFFGMPILTAILSLLMVAMALFLFKRFK